MARDKRNNVTDIATGQGHTAEQVASELEQGSAPAAVETPVAGPNFQLTYRREHPGARCSYGIAGNAGIVVFDRGLFADPTFNGPITLSCEMVQPKVDNKQAKAEAQAAKLAEKATKAQAKIDAAAAKAKEKADKAAEALAKAQAKVAAAQATAAAVPEVPATE